MVELEADDALASAASVAAEDPAVDRVVICTPDKDLAQCVVGQRVVQLDRRSGTVSDEAGVWAKFGVAPRSIPDWLALVGDSADGFPGLAGWGKRSASVVLAHYGSFDDVPDRVAAIGIPEVRGAVRGAAKLAERLAGEREQAELFRVLATLRVDRSLLDGVPVAAVAGTERRDSKRCAGSSGTRHWPSAPRPCRAAERPGSPGGAEDVVELGRDRGVELRVGTRLRCAVRSPSDERGGVAEPVPLEVVVGHLGHQLGAQRLPTEVLSAAPPARPPGTRPAGVDLEAATGWPFGATSR